MSQHSGYHLIADIKTSDTHEKKLLQDQTFLQNLLQEAADAAGATCLGIKGHKFGAEEGVTAFAMLAESHISIHSWPENGFLALDIFMCGPSSVQIHKALEIFKAKFASAVFTEQCIKRDYSG